jgi:hypothetical protein
LGSIRFFVFWVLRGAIRLTWLSFGSFSFGFGLGFGEAGATVSL